MKSDAEGTQLGSSTSGCCIGASALTPHAALSDRYHGCRKPPAPGFYHLREQAGIDRVLQGLAESTDSRLGMYQLYDYGQVPSLPLNFGVLFC